MTSDISGRSHPHFGRWGCLRWVCIASLVTTAPARVGQDVQQRLEAGDLVALLADVQLGKDQAGGVLQCGEQMDLPVLRLGNTPQALFHGQAAQLDGPVGFGRRSASHLPIARSSASPAMPASSRRTVVSAGRTRLGRSGSGRTPTCWSTYAGASAIHSPTASSEVAPASTAHAVSVSTTVRRWRTPRGSHGSATSASRSRRPGTSLDTTCGYSRSWPRVRDYLMERQ